MHAGWLDAAFGLSLAGAVAALGGVALGGGEPAGALGLVLAGAAAHAGVVRDHHRRREACAADEAARGATSPWLVHETQRADLMHRWVMTGGALALGGASLWALGRPAGPPPAGTGMVLACLLGALPAVVVRTAIASAPVAGAPALARVLLEVQLALTFSALAGIGVHAWSEVPLWTARALFAWTVLTATEQALRGMALLFSPLAADPRSTEPPVRSALRHLFLRSGNPLEQLRRALEERLGITLRAGFGFDFVATMAPPVLGAVVLVLWLSSALHVVPLDALAFRERFGVREPALLGPGLHVSLPWPWGAVRGAAVRRLRALPLGFVEATDAPRKHLLWTRQHDVAEYPLALGGGTELLAVNALLHYRVRADAAGLEDFLYRHQQPEAALSATAHRALLASTRAGTLEGVLSTNRQAFVDELFASIRARVAAERLGVEPVSLSLLSLHPSVEAAPSYLSVISARLGARRAVLEARAAGEVAISKAEGENVGIVAAARVDEERRVALATAETARFRALREAQSAGADTLSLRLWLDTFQEALAARSVVLVDASLAADGAALAVDLRPRPLVPAPPARPEEGR